VRPTSLLAAFLLGALAADAWAQPPVSAHYARKDELLARLTARAAELTRQEEFAARPRVERMVVLFGRGETRFDGEAMTGESVVREVLEAEEVQVDGPSEDARRVFAALSDALHERYGFIYASSKDQSQQRYRASRLLVDALTSPYPEVRRGAIACLERLYDRTLEYDPDASESSRRARQRAWKQELRRWR